MQNIDWILYRPVHDCPFPVYPVLHVHIKLPGVLVHVASVWQLSELVEHSSISRWKMNSTQN